MLAFGAGIMAMAWWPALTPKSGLVSVLTIAALLFGFVPRVAVFLLGFSWCGWFAHGAIEDRWTHEDSGTVHSVVGEVASLPIRVGESKRFEFATQNPGFPRKVRVYWYRPVSGLEPGQVWRLPLKLDAPNGQLNIGGFDYERYLLVEGIGAIARVDATQSSLKIEFLGKSNSTSTFLNTIRQWLSDRLKATTIRLDIVSLKQALLIGDRSGITQTTHELLSKTGTSHLLAISGLHIGLMVGFVVLMMKLIWPICALFADTVSRKEVSIAVASAGAIFYAGLAGFSTSALRATVMVLVLTVALLARRSIRPFDALLTAGLVLLIHNPLTILSVGFWLSFGAVALLIWCFSARYNSASGMSSVSQLLRAQCVLGIGLLPLSIGFFGQSTPVAFIANLAAIPWVSLVVLPTLVIDATILTLGIESTFWRVVNDTSFEWLLLMLEYFANLPWGHQTRAFPDVSVIIIGCVGAIWFLAPAGWPVRWFGAILLTPLLMGKVDERSPTELKIFVADVGSAVSSLIEVGEYRMLYGLGLDGSAGRDHLSSWLAHWPSADPYSQRLRIDDVVIPQTNSEAIVGLAHLKRLASVERIYHPHRDSYYVKDVDWASIHRCERGEVLEHGVWTIDMIHPGPFLPDLGNSSSCVIRIRSEHLTVLLAGALDSIGEKHLVTMYPELQAQILLIGKLGHRDATSNEWLSQLNPQLALLSVDSEDRYQRPHSETLARLANNHIPLLSTAQCHGFWIEANAHTGAWVARTVSGDHPRFWRSSGMCLAREASRKE